MTKEEYNEVPVYYCKHCLSLDIRALDKYDYCNNCGNTHIGVALIDNWERLYENRYGEKLINNLKH